MINDRELEFPPGDRFSYRNSGYYLLGMIVERVERWALDDDIARAVLGLPPRR